MPADQILLSGASGLIGSSVIRALGIKSIHPIKLVRQPLEPGERELLWDPSPAAGQDSLPGLTQLDAAIHLSGANVAAHRWTRAYKEEIIGSRVDTTLALCRILTKLERPPSVLLCASAIGLYGDRGNEVLDEDSPAGHGFLAEACKAWEAATRRAEDAGIRVVHMRFGVVLSPRDGALGKLAPLFKLGLGGKLGSGRQWMSWVTLEDAVAAILRALDDPQLRGAVNVTSPQPVTNAEFTQAMGRVLRRPAAMAVPAFALRMMAGQMADEALLASCRAIPAKLLKAGFEFADPILEPALRKMLA